MNTSPQEKEKLRKRLQKLFQREGAFEGSAKSTSHQQPKVTAKKNMNKINSPKVDSNKSGNMNKQKQKSPKAPTVQPIQNGHAKPAGKHCMENKTVKSKKLSLKNAEPKLPKKNNGKNIKTKEKVFSEKQSQKPQKKIEVNKELKKPAKTKNFGSQVKPANSINEGQKKQKCTKFKSEKNNSAANTSANKTQSKKTKKRKVLNGAAPASNKRQKLLKNGTQEDVKINQKKRNVSDESISSSSELENEYDVNYMAGCVPGGDFDSASDESCEEQRYWLEEENSSAHDDEDELKYNSWLEDEEHSDEESEDYHFESDTSSKETNNQLGKFKEFSDSECEFETDDYDSGSFEEEDENYSDYDEDDYEAEEDSYSYASGSDSASSAGYEDFDDYYECDSDMDYELREHVPEDLIIHKGTCIQRDLRPEDNVSFDSDNEDAQIVELENQETLKVIEQPKVHVKAKLIKLQTEEENLSLSTFQQKDATHDDDNDEEVCPRLVPIVDKDGFQLYNPNEQADDSADEEDLDNCEEESIYEYEDDDMDDVSLGSEYTEIDSDAAGSLLSEDINEKYLKKFRHDSSDSDENMNENMWIKRYKADVIDATGCEWENALLNTSEHSEGSLNDDINQIPCAKLYKNVYLKTESKILSTTIIDNKIPSPKDNFKRGLSTKDQDPKGDESSTDESLRVIKPHRPRFLKYNTKFFNAFSSNSVLVLLRDPFYIYGTVRLTLLAGSMEVYGHSLKLNTEVEIFSPRGCSVIEIASSPTKTDISQESLSEILKSYKSQFCFNDLKTIESLYNPETDAVVLLRRNEERKKVVQQYKKFMNENVFPNINNISADRHLYNSEYLLRCMINISSQEQKCLRLPKDWQKFELTSRSRVMLAGGKSVGKSTLLRYLINRHLPRKVLLIDLDIGQPEVFIPQTVSCTVIEQPLLGPGFLLNLQPEISFAVGHTNIALCAHKYLSAVRSLLAYCREQKSFEDIPWLVNTMGYNKGFGLELISVLVQEPLTDVIQLQSSKEINNFESTLQAHVLSNIPHVLFSEEYERIKEELKSNWNYRLHVWPSAVQQESRYQKEWEMSAKDLRFAMLLARLSQALQGHADWLTDVKPVSASLNDLKIINLMDDNTLVSPEELVKSLEANLVYLCQYEEDDKPLKCLGIGIVRGVDLHVRHVYLIPALPYNHLKHVNCLGIGEMPLPASLFINQGPRIKDTAPFVYNTVAASASKAIKQIYHRPAKFLKGKHKSLE